MSRTGMVTSTTSKANSSRPERKTVVFTRGAVRTPRPTLPAIDRAPWHRCEGERSADAGPEAIGKWRKGVFIKFLIFYSAGSIHTFQCFHDPFSLRLRLL